MKNKKIVLVLAGVIVLLLLLNMARNQDTSVVPVQEMVNNVADKIAQITTDNERKEMPDSFELKDALPRVEGQELESETSDDHDQNQKNKKNDDVIKIIQSETAVDENGNKVEMYADVEDMMWGKVKTYGTSSGNSGSKSGSGGSSSSSKDTADEIQTESDAEVESQQESNDEQETSEQETSEQETPEHNIPGGGDVGIPNSLDEYNKLSVAEEVEITKQFSSVVEYNAYINRLRKEDAIAKGAKDGSKDNSIK